MAHYLFLPDDETTPQGKSLLLSQHLAGYWRNFDIAKIERIEESQDTTSGWEATLKDS